jgi:hypothetical protein
MTKRRQRELARQAYADHAAINGCLTTFEEALDVAPSASSGAWLRRLRVELAPLLDCLAEHRDSAEADDGLLTEIEVTLGRNYEVSTARRLHRSASQRAEDLSERVRTPAADIDHDELRKAGRRLGSAIRRHHELEADLILMAFYTDIGTVD